ncbi:MAG: AcvB/VirJ family lysyl-phosphatidylglycerol hydrolase [Rhizobium sp.]
MRKLSAVAATLLFALSVPLMAAAVEYDAGHIPKPEILLPDDTAKVLVVLLSDTKGWTSTEESEAQRLKDNGSIVIGINTPAYLAELRKDDGECVYMISDIEDLVHQAERSAEMTTYLPPIVAGIGDGGALALAMLAQTPRATIGQTLAVDPQVGIPLLRQLCTPAERTVSGDRMIYGLTAGELPDPLTVVFSSAAPPSGRQHVDRLVATHDDIDVQNLDADAASILSTTLDDLIATQSTDDPLGLPLDILEVASPTHDTMAVVYSGDGGWRDLDREVAGYLQQQGVPVVGVDSLRYFWSEKSPQQTADDLAKIVRTYGRRWKVRHILLVGYSFGADVLPTTYNHLPDRLKQRVAQLSLMALSHQVDYEISVTGWLGVPGAGAGGDPLTDIKLIDPGLVQCFYGKDEQDDACRDLKGSKVEVNELEGGHHFDGDYESLARLIIDRLVRKLTP